MMKFIPWSEWEEMDVPPFVLRADSLRSDEEPVSFYMDRERCWKTWSDQDGVILEDDADREELTLAISTRE